MGNRQSGGGRDRDGRSSGHRVIEGVISDALSAISERTFDWNDLEEDSIWDEASLAEDLHSLGETSSFSFGDDDNLNAFELLPGVIKIKQQIEKTKYRLLKAQSKTLEKRRDMKVELKSHRSDLKKTEKLLKKIARRAPSYFGYFDYWNMVKRSYNVKKNEKIYEEHSPAQYFKQDLKNNLKRDTTKSNRPMSTALVTGANSFYFSIFALWEAYLLKKTHIAVMQSNQQKIQKKGWNGIVMLMQQEKIGVVEAFDDKEFVLNQKIEALRSELTALRSVYTDLVRCQEKIIQKLQEHENWMSGSALNVNLSEDEDSSAFSEESDDSVVSIPLEINADNDHEGMSVMGHSFDGLSLSIVTHDTEKQETTEDAQIEKDVDEKVDVSVVQDKEIEEETPTENASEEENQDTETKSNEEMEKKTTTKESAPVTGDDADPESLEKGMPNNSLPLDEKKEDSLHDSPVSVKNEALLEKPKEVQGMLNIVRV